MKISKSHDYFARQHEPESIENPEKFLGLNYLAVLNFWQYLDTLDEQQWLNVIEKYDPILPRFGAHDNYHSKFVYTNRPFWNNVFDVILDRASVRILVREAAYEIYIMDALFKDGKQLIYLPLFSDL
jgi:hypothetical protein